LLLSELVAASAAVGATRSRIRKREVLADTLRSLEANEIEVAVSYLSGELPQGRRGTRETPSVPPLRVREPVL